MSFISGPQRRVILPGEPQLPGSGPQRRVILPGEPQAIFYRRTVKGYRVEWDEPSENF